MSVSSITGVHRRRRHEGCSLQPDPATPVARIHVTYPLRESRRDGGTWTYTPASHKTAHHGKRLIPLGPKAVELLKQFVTDDPEAYLFRPTDAVAEHHARRSAARISKPTPSEVSKREACPGAKHATRYRRHTYHNAINRACDRTFDHPTFSTIPARRLTDEQRAELAAWRTSHRWHPNQTRHTVATEIRAKYRLEAAQVILGHSRADVTQVYDERNLEQARKVMVDVG